ncbi:MAG: hypothetical protein MJ236_03215 [Clostridia bacterium]|nr:hypothetical protein [Clostridia bacterium]
MEALYIVLIVLAVLIGIYLFMIFPSLNKKDKLFDRVRRFAHRGLFGGDIPENSMAAFKEAVNNGYGIELDVHVTTDNVAVISHDDSLKRMFGIDKEIEKCTYEEICDATLPNGEKIPLFTDFLKFIDGQVPLMVELKCSKTDKRVAQVCAPILKEYKGEYCVESFNPIVVGEYRKLDKKVLCGQLAGWEKPKTKPSFKNRATFFGAYHMLFNFISRPDFVSFQYEHRNELAFNICKALGSYISIWTINTPDKNQECIKRNEVSIFQDFKA